MYTNTIFICNFVVQLIKLLKIFTKSEYFSHSTQVIKLLLNNNYLRYKGKKLDLSTENIEKSNSYFIQINSV